MRALSTLSLILSLSASTLAFAQSPAAPIATPGAAAPAAGAGDAGRAKFRNACGADIQKLCATAGPAETANATPEMKKEQRGKVRACLAANKATLSTACTAFLVEREAAQAAKKN